MRQSWIRRVIEPVSGRRSRAGVSRTVCDGSWTASADQGAFDSLPQPVRTELVEKQGAGAPIGVLTETSALMPPLDCGHLGKLTLPTLLVTGERSPAMFLLVTAELERCLEGESQVMVPNAGHGMHGDNPTFYNQAVMAFLQRR